MLVHQGKVLNVATALQDPLQNFSLPDWALKNAVIFKIKIENRKHYEVSINRNCERTYQTGSVDKPFDSVVFPK